MKGSILASRAVRSLSNLLRILEEHRLNSLLELWVTIPPAERVSMWPRMPMSLKCDIIRARIALRDCCMQKAGAI